MSDTKATITESIIRDLSGGPIPSDTPYSFDFVLRHVVDAIRADLKLEMLERRNGDEDRTAPSIYKATYLNIELSEEAVTKRIFFTLPDIPFGSKYDNGVVHVADMEHVDVQYVPVANPGVTRHLQHASYERKTSGFYQEGTKIFFMRNIMRDGVRNIFLKLLVPPPDSLANDAPLPLFPENVARIKDIVKQRVLNRMPNDRISDTNPNIVPENV